MKLQRKKISKQYNNLFLDKIANLLRVDDGNYDASEIKEIFEDSHSIIEDQIQKDIAYTLNEYTFYDFNGSTIIVDEGNYCSLSGITDENGNVITYSRLIYDTNQFKIYFDATVSVKELHVVFYTGYPEDNLDKAIRRALYIILTDLYDSERSSYTLGSSKKSDVLDRLLSTHRKTFFYNYSNNNYFNLF
jgi:hypothetical protein